MKGQCLCGKVTFEVASERLGIYHCHCSQCRRLTGSAFNAGCFTQADDFKWSSGEAEVTSYIEKSGYHSAFCKHCGSSVPNKSGASYYWIPAGTLDDTSKLEVRAHLFIDSKAEWDIVSSKGTQYKTKPTLEKLTTLLHKDNS